MRWGSSVEKAWQRKDFCGGNRVGCFVFAGDTPASTETSQPFNKSQIASNPGRKANRRAT
jgi:hypothetical protein